MSKYTLAALAVATALPAAYADSIETLTIYSSRQVQTVEQSLASVTVLEREDILARQVQDLPALLNQLPGVTIARDGGRGQSSGVFIRGGNSGHTLVLVDGVRTGSATLGQASLAMIPLDMIERIEVIRGPRAAWYGSDAVAGVIAITTRRQQQTEFNAGVGSYGLLESDLGLQHQQGSLQLQANVGYSRADGFNVQPALDPDKDGYWQRFARFGAAYQSDIGHFHWHSHINSGRYDFDTAWGSEDRSAVLQRSHVLGWQHQLGQTGHQLQLSRNLDSDTTFGPDSRSPFSTARDEVNYQLTQTVLAGLDVLLGANWYQEEVAKAAPAYEESKRNNRAWFTGLNYQLEQWLFEAAIRQDRFSQYGRERTWQLAAGYYFTEQWLLRVSRGTAFQVPSFNQLYWPGFGNPDLKPEESVSNEIALRYSGLQLQSELVLFERDVTNLIQGGEQAENVLLATVRGAEYSLGMTQDSWQHQLAYTWLDSRNEQSGEPLQRRPKHSVNVRSGWHGESWQWFATLDYQSATFQGFDWNSNANHPDLGGFTLLGVGASYQLTPQWQLSAKLDNLSNKTYQTSIGYATAGRTLGIRVRYLGF
ncbi:TonB-dependent receptor domain-containing protein [Alkalimonas mucilaginosa]|uniref:TonB-dependent receptor n=1 Tax=Alkalimonas mucilaginosa TaxID=3057676 RepID=A0ABU7JGA0_9GAMM|nr:TonB-dependent receptor [Alkalimonas sp. MEB004]MEE2024721.1 TonB-dependent receptor [Alkalimonas sp. MEB004]